MSHAIYTMIAIEDVFTYLKKISKTQSPFPSNASAANLILQVLKNNAVNCTRSSWKKPGAMSQFAIA